MFEPMINCGYSAGDNPMCWDGTLFQTEEECEKWIKENMENFSQNEIGGGIFPSEVNVSVNSNFEDITETRPIEEWATSDVEQLVLESADVHDILYQAEGYMTKEQYREFLINVANGLSI